MKNIASRFYKSLFIALITFVICQPILGIHIEQSNLGLSLHYKYCPVDGCSAILGMLYCFIAAVFVFIAQFFISFNLTEKIKLIGKNNEANIFRKIFPTFLFNQKFFVIVILIFALSLPFWSSRAVLSIATLALIYVLLGLGLNIVVGFAGLLDLGYVGFYAVGAYTYAILQQHGIGFWSSIPIAAVFAAFLGILLGFPVLRLRGDYLAIVTLGFGEIIRILLRNLDKYTGGPYGIAGIPSPTFFNISFERKVPEGMRGFSEMFGLKFSSEYKLAFMYFIILLFCIFTVFIISRLRRMPVGRAWEALREDETACRSLGINPTTVKLSAFALGALFAGIAGVFFAARQGHIDPESFSFMESAIILAIVVLGGMGSQLGVIIAAILLTALPEFLREFSQYRMLIFGAVMVLMMIWRPQGLLPVKRPKLALGGKKQIEQMLHAAEKKKIAESVADTDKTEIAVENAAVTDKESDKNLKPAIKINLPQPKNNPDTGEA
ncbi:MAG: high-affinity branched-chain amino acid ABC transporter permease LivM [Cardiobacteriaceae bacterium]|nr:high-affinity branched-chain amino acid ABC transporter permease LivM [Cardiobacteriaceae bacterium]